MAYTVLTDAFIKFTKGTDTVTLTDAGSAVAIAYTAQPIEIGVMGQRNKMRFGGGPVDWSAEFEVVIDESEHGDFFFSWMGEAVDIEVRKTSAAVSATNPSYSGTAILTNYQILGSGKHGDVVNAQLSFVGASDLVRAES